MLLQICMLLFFSGKQKEIKQLFAFSFLYKNINIM